MHDCLCHEGAVRNRKQINFVIAEGASDPVNVASALGGVVGGQVYSGFAEPVSTAEERGNSMRVGCRPGYSRGSILQRLFITLGAVEHRLGVSDAALLVDDNGTL